MERLGKAGFGGQCSGSPAALAFASVTRRWLAVCYVLTHRTGHLRTPRATYGSRLQQGVLGVLSVGRGSFSGHPQHAPCSSLIATRCELGVPTTVVMPNEVLQLSMSRSRRATSSEILACEQPLRFCTRGRPPSGLH
jgi:hypothetical protein